MKMDMIQMKHTVRANTKNKLTDIGSTRWGDEYNVESQQPKTKELQVSNKTLEIKIWSDSLRIRVPLSVKEPLPKLNEPLQQLEAHVARLTRLAYPALPENIIEWFAIQIFEMDL